MWLGNMATSTGGNREKALLRKQGDYNSDTRTLSKNPNPKIHPSSLSHKE